MSVVVGMTKQGVRNLNNMGPKKSKPVAAETVVADETAGEAPATVVAPPVDAVEAAVTATA